MVGFDHVNREWYVNHPRTHASQTRLAEARRGRLSWPGRPVREARVEWMLLFAAHDPAAKNVIRPVYKHALNLGHHARFIDLAASHGLTDQARSGEFLESGKATAAILGCSSNQDEWPLIRACKARGIPTGMVVDIGTLTRLDTMTGKDFPGWFMVSNQSCYQEVIDLGADSARVVVTGNCHLEVLSNLQSPDSRELVRDHYGLAPDDSVIPFFCSPDTGRSVDAVVSLGSLLPAVQLHRPRVIIRPHPRSPQQERLESVSWPFPFLQFDGGGPISNSTLLSDSLFSLSMGSTVTLESLVLGVPSAFFQVNWDFNDLNHLYRNLVDVVRIRTEKQLHEFVAAVTRNEGPTVTGNVENHLGALDRTWRVVEELIAAGA